MDQSRIMDTEEFQFPSHPPDLKLFHSSDQLVPENDAESFLRTSPLSSPSYQLHLLRLSSDSDDSFENLSPSPFSLCSMEFSITEGNQCQKEEEQFNEHPSEIIFDSLLEIDDVTMAATGKGEDSRRPRARSNSLNPHSDARSAKNSHRQTGQPKTTLGRPATDQKLTRQIS